MKAHVKIYMKYFGYGIDSVILCEVCGYCCNDIHHINGRIGKDANKIENLIGLCRSCHTSAHAERISKETLHTIHNLNIVK